MGGSGKSTLCNKLQKELGEKDDTSSQKDEERPI